MNSSGQQHRRHALLRRRLGRGTAALLGGVALAALAVAPAGASPAAATPAVAAVPAATSPVSCAPGDGLDTRFTTAPSTGVGAPTVRSVRVANLTDACEGDSLVLVLRGNAGGDPTFDSHVLSTVDSSLTPCSQLPRPKGDGLVTGGAITFTLCPTGGVDGAASVHDITELEVAGATVTLVPTVVLGTTATRGETASAGRAGTSASADSTPTGSTTKPGVLALTGTSAAILIGVGLTLILAGLISVALGRRRNGQGISAGRDHSTTGEDRELDDRDRDLDDRQLETLELEPQRR